MGDIIEIFDDKRKKYVEVVISDPFEMKEQDYERIESALIRFADELAMAN